MGEGWSEIQAYKKRKEITHFFFLSSTKACLLAEGKIL